MRRALLYIPAAGFLLALLVLVLSITTTRLPASPCPTCGKPMRVTENKAVTLYSCNQCLVETWGPPRVGLSWTDAAMTWLGE
jgi:hypothetical protein